jgi:hypothetical protein
MPTFSVRAARRLAWPRFGEPQRAARAALAAGVAPGVVLMDASYGTTGMFAKPAISRGYGGVAWWIARWWRTCAQKTM